MTWRPTAVTCYETYDLGTRRGLYYFVAFVDSMSFRFARFRCSYVGVFHCVYAIALHGALTGGRPHRLRLGAGRVSVRDATAASQCSLS
eukprot:6197823-Pleurochrysis_carterae.AAC.1